MFYSVHIVPKLNKLEDAVVTAVCEALTNTAYANGVEVVPLNQITGSTLIVAVGGDGTMLEAMRLSAKYDAVCFGINLGRIGFLTDFSIKTPSPHGTLEDMFAKLLRDQIPYVIEKRTALVVDLPDSYSIACNEFSVAPPTSDTMLRYHLWIDDISAGVHRANSLMVSTATGSTAYSLAAGGSLMYPTLDALQIVPVAPATLTSRPILVPATCVIRLDVDSSDPVQLRNDGQLVSRGISSVTFRKYLHPVQSLHLPGWNYFETLTEKLGWIKE